LLNSLTYMYCAGCAGRGDKLVGAILAPTAALASHPFRELLCSKKLLIHRMLGLLNPRWSHQNPCGGFHREVSQQATTWYVWILCLVLTFEFSFPAACMQPSKGRKGGGSFSGEKLLPFYAHFLSRACGGSVAYRFTLKPLRNFSSACRARARKGGGREIAERVAHFGRPRARAVACPAAQPGRPVP
jgi:hypothetical protein